MAGACAWGSWRVQDRELKELFTELESRVHHHNTKGDMLRSVCVELGVEIEEFDKRCVGAPSRRCIGAGLCH